MFLEAFMSRRKKEVWKDGGPVLVEEPVEMAPEGEAPVVEDQALVAGVTDAVRVTPDKLLEAKALFIKGEADLYDIAIDLEVPVTQVACWARDGHWMAARREVQKVISEGQRLAEERFVLENRLPAARAQMDVVNKAVKKASGLVDGAQSASELRRIAESMGSLSNVAERAVGMNMKESADETADESGGRKKKTPLVVIGITPREVTVEERSIN
jgi:hypothetical protein